MPELELLREKLESKQRLVARLNEQIKEQKKQLNSEYSRAKRNMERIQLMGMAINDAKPYVKSYLGEDHPFYVNMCEAVK